MILSGLAVGFESAVYTAIVIGAAVFGASLLGGATVSLFAVALAGCGLLTTVGVIVAMDTFGPVSDNAQGIAEMSGDVSPEGAQILTELDAVGNTTKAITKGIAIATAVLAAHRAVRLLHATLGARAPSAITGEEFLVRRRLSSTPTRSSWACSSVPPWCSSSGLAINAVGRAAGAVVYEVRRQFREIPGIMEGTGRPRVRQGRRHRHQGLAARAGDAGHPGDPGADRGRLRPRRRRRWPASWPVRSCTGTLMAVFLANSGGAWDNAKKLVEDGHHGGKGSPGPRGDDHRRHRR